MPHDEGREVKAAMPARQLTPSAGKKHVLVTGGAGYIGSHAALELLGEGHVVTVVDDLSRGNMGAVEVLQQNAADGAFQFIKADLGDANTIAGIFACCGFDTVMHFAAVAYVGALPSMLALSIC